MRKVPPPDRGYVPVAIRFTVAELRLLEEFCAEDFRSVASWFRRAVHRGWITRETRKRKPSGLWRRRELDGEAAVSVYARLTPEERIRLNLLCDEEGVAASEWFCRQLVDELGEAPPAPPHRTVRPRRTPRL